MRTRFLPSALRRLHAVAVALALAVGGAAASAGPANAGTPAAYDGTLVATGPETYRLQLDQPVDGAGSLPLDPRGNSLALSWLAAHPVRDVAEARVRLVGHAAAGQLAVESAATLTELVGWLTTNVYHAAGNDPRQLSKVEIALADCCPPPVYGVAVPRPAGGFDFVPFAATDQPSAAALAKRAPESGGLHLLAIGTLEAGSLSGVRLLHERHISGYAVTTDFAATGRPLPESTRAALLDPAHAITGYGYVADGCGGYEYFPFDRASWRLVREIVQQSPTATVVKLDLRGFFYWQDRTIKVASVSAETTPPKSPLAVELKAFAVTRGLYLQEGLQRKKTPARPLDRAALLDPAQAASELGLAYKACCRLGFYHLDPAGRARLRALVDSAPPGAAIQVVARGTLDLDLLTIESLALDDGTAEVRHPLRGRILTVDTAAGTLLVKHREIPGFMMAMTMQFRATPAVLALAQPGQEIAATLVQRGDDYWLEDLKPAQP